MNKTISVIIPTLNAESSIRGLIESLISQSLQPDEIVIVDSESDDRTVEIAREFHIVKIIQIKRTEFNHGGTRDMALKQSCGDYVVFMTQDAVPANNMLLEKLILPFDSDEKIAVITARQLPRYDAKPSEKLIREFNYPLESSIRSKEDIPRLGIKTFFTSDVCSAYRRDIYEELGGFEKDLKTSEDMMYAAKLVNNGYSICYNAKAKVLHSHNFTIKEQYKRNFIIGYEIERHKKLLGNVSANSEGFKLTKVVSFGLLKKGRIISFFRFGLDCCARFAGNKAGKKAARNCNNKYDIWR